MFFFTKEFRYKHLFPEHDSGIIKANCSINLIFPKVEQNPAESLMKRIAKNAVEGKR